MALTRLPTCNTGLWRVPEPPRTRPRWRPCSCVISSTTALVSPWRRVPSTTPISAHCTGSVLATTDDEFKMGLSIAARQGFVLTATRQNRFADPARSKPRPPTLPAVGATLGATLVVARLARHVCRQQGDHKGRPQGRPYVFPDPPIPSDWLKGA